MVKHKIMSLVLASLLAVSYPVSAFAAESGNATGVNSQSRTSEAASAEAGAENTNVTEVKHLSLEEAIKIMTTSGTRAETAELNKESDTAIANGYSENYKTISDGLDTIKTANSQSVSAQQILMQYHLDPSNATNLVLASTVANVTNQTIANSITAARDAGVSYTNKNIMKERRDFARKYADDNYKADINQIEKDTINIYNTVLLAEENYKIAQDNLAAQKKTLQNVTAKKNAGVLSKKDVLEAQSAVTDAESDVRSAKTKMDYAHMSFNFLLGFDPMQEVVLTDKLTKTDDEVADVNTAVKNALANRNEIKGADFAESIYKILAGSVSAYPKSSSTRMTADINYKNAQKTAKDARAQIEIDVRNKAAVVSDKKAELDAAIALQEYASEGLRLVQLTYEEGISTPDELLAMQVKVYQSNLNVANTTAAYNLAVIEYNEAQGVGTMRIPL